MNLRPFLLLLGLFSPLASGFYKDNAGLATELVALMGLAYFSSDHGLASMSPVTETKEASAVGLLTHYQDDTEVIRLSWDNTEPDLKFCASAPLTIQELVTTAPPSNEIRIVQDKSCLVMQSDENSGTTLLRITGLKFGDFLSDVLASQQPADTRVMVNPLLFPEFPPDQIPRAIRIEVHPELWDSLEINPRYQDPTRITYLEKRAGTGTGTKSGSGHPGSGGEGGSNRKNTSSGHGSGGAAEERGEERGSASSSGAGDGDDGDDFIRKTLLQMLFGNYVSPPLGYQVMMLVLRLMLTAQDSDQFERDRLLNKFYGLNCVNRVFPVDFQRVLQINLVQLEKMIKSLSDLQQQLILETFSDEERVKNYPLGNSEAHEYFAPGLKARFM